MQRRLINLIEFKKKQFIVMLVSMELPIKTGLLLAEQRIEKKMQNLLFFSDRRNGINL